MDKLCHFFLLRKPNKLRVQPITNVKNKTRSETNCTTYGLNNIAHSVIIPLKLREVNNLDSWHYKSPFPQLGKNKESWIDAIKAAREGLDGHLLPQIDCQTLSVIKACTQTFSDLLDSCVEMTWNQATPLHAQRFKSVSAYGLALRPQIIDSIRGLAIK